jgi:hypothetical protein
MKQNKELTHYVEITPYHPFQIFSYVDISLTFFKK